MEPKIINTLNVRAIEYGRLGGLKGGKANELSKEQRVEIADEAAKARLGKK